MQTFEDAQEENLKLNWILTDDLIELVSLISPFRNFRCSNHGCINSFRKIKNRCKVAEISIRILQMMINDGTQLENILNQAKAVQIAIINIPCVTVHFSCCSVCYRKMKSSRDRAFKACEKIRQLNSCLERFQDGHTEQQIQSEEIFS